MQRIIRQASIFLALVLVISLVRIPYGSYKEEILPWLKKEGAKSGLLSIDAEDFVVSFPTKLTIQKLNALFRAGPLPLPVYVDSMVFSLRLLPLFLLKTALVGEANAYSGRIDVEASRGMFGGNMRVVASGNNIDLAQYPAFRPLGGQGGLSFNFTAESQSEPVTPADIDTAKLSMNISNASITGSGGLIPLIKIPPVTDLNAKLDAQLRKAQWSINSFDVTSSMGTAKGSGTGRLQPNGSVGQGTITVRLELTDAGVTTFGGYLALAAGLPVDKPPARWQIETQLKPGSKAMARVTAG